MSDRQAPISSTAAQPAVLLYAHDPMCSWCWAFRPVIQSLREQLLHSEVRYRPVLGGLAPDSDDPMPDTMRTYLQETWRRIEQQVPGTRFNHAFWVENTPRRSTYPACRALIAARQQDHALYDPVLSGIQEAYYLNARNPSNRDTLIEIAEHSGCDAQHFADTLDAEETNRELMQEIAFVRSLGIQGFPALVVQRADQRYVPIAIDYLSADRILEQIEAALAG